nr:unnamed protein product [Callosobruchus analis]
MSQERLTNLGKI